MTRIVLLALGLLLAPAALLAQEPLQSLRPTQSACAPGSQSLRVCQNDIVSCNSVCNARALDASADIAGCGTRCCVQFNTCLRLRGCGARIIDCD
ncbi:MAG: hypothetical protein ACRECX_02015 [Methyloceanibacter sp.]|uniref:hypothetical protein n=1 Tax=Methyloceanibacter sp. TaxID=1965321 RepID=UPI003D6D9023